MAVAVLLPVEPTSAACRMVFLVVARLCYVFDELTKMPPYASTDPGAGLCWCGQPGSEG